MHFLAATPGDQAAQQSGLPVPSTPVNSDDLYTDYYSFVIRMIMLCVFIMIITAMSLIYPTFQTPENGVIFLPTLLQPKSVGSISLTSSGSIFVCSSFACDLSSHQQLYTV
jgi:hypothetical protein